MFQKVSTLWLAIVFIIGVAILAAAWAYSGQVLPHKPITALSTYDEMGFYIELCIWVVTIISGVVLLGRLLTWRSDSRQ